MKNYVTYTADRKIATQANSKKEAAKKMGVKTSKVFISHVHVDFCQARVIK